MFQSSEEGNYWKVTFQEGVNFIEDIFSGYYHDKTPKEYLDYAARYDLTFLTPCSRQVRCKVSLFTIAINVIGACFYNSRYLNGPEARNQSLKNSEADSGSSPFFSLANSFISLFSNLFEPLSWIKTEQFYGPVKLPNFREKAPSPLIKTCLVYLTRCQLSQPNSHKLAMSR